MKIGVAQTRPARGDIPANIAHHKKLIGLAILHAADLIIFPELSLTGYEPKLAKELAIDPDDPWLEDFQKISDAKDIMIGVGMPVRSEAGILIGMFLFQPHRSRQLYTKQYLHADEEPYFVNGRQSVFLSGGGNRIAPAICYELSVPEHAENAFRNGANIYMASVAKTAAGVVKAAETLSGIADRYAMTVLMSNCVGPCDDFESGGKTAVWYQGGILAGQLDDTHEGILVMDTDTQELITQTL